MIQVKINLEGVKGIFSEEQIKILKDTFQQLEKEYKNIHFSEINISAVKNSLYTELKILIPTKKILLKTKTESSNFDFLVQHSYNKIKKQIKRYQSYL